MYMYLLHSRDYNSSSRNPPLIFNSLRRDVQHHQCNDVARGRCGLISA